MENICTRRFMTKECPRDQELIQLQFFCSDVFSLRGLSVHMSKIDTKLGDTCIFFQALIFPSTPAVSACSHSHWIQLPMQGLDLAFHRWWFWPRTPPQRSPTCQQSSLPCQGGCLRRAAEKGGIERNFGHWYWLILWNHMKWYELDSCWIKISVRNWYATLF